MKVVLLHALPLDERMWESQVAVLDGHEVVAPKLYPLGSSMEEWADGVLALAGGGPLVLVGASMGGYCSLAIARRVPERVRAVLLA
nr:alpha/beta fold hydrolase [Actinomycetota bacterium]